MSTKTTNSTKRNFTNEAGEPHPTFLSRKPVMRKNSLGCECHIVTLRSVHDWPLSSKRLSTVLALPISPFMVDALRGHPKPATEGHLKTGQRE
jgi:hypothetical protein